MKQDFCKRRNRIWEGRSHSILVEWMGMSLTKTSQTRWIQVWETMTCFIDILIALWTFRQRWTWRSWLLRDTSRLMSKIGRRWPTDGIFNLGRGWATQRIDYTVYVTQRQNLENTIWEEIKKTVKERWVRGVAWLGKTEIQNGRSYLTDNSVKHKRHMS